MHVFTFRYSQLQRGRPQNLPRGTEILYTQTGFSISMPVAPLGLRVWQMAVWASASGIRAQGAPRAPLRISHVLAGGASAASPRDGAAADPWKHTTRTKTARDRTQRGCASGWCGPQQQKDDRGDVGCNGLNNCTTMHMCRALDPRYTVSDSRQHLHNT